MISVPKGGSSCAAMFRQVGLRLYPYLGRAASMSGITCPSRMSFACLMSAIIVLLSQFLQENDVEDRRYLQLSGFTFPVAGSLICVTSSKARGCAMASLVFPTGVRCCMVVGLIWNVDVSMVVGVVESDAFSVVVVSSLGTVHLPYLSNPMFSHS